MTVWDEVSARQWVDRSTRVEDVEFPWHLATDLVTEAGGGAAPARSAVGPGGGAGVARPAVGRVLDAAAGPGGFLAVALDTFPDAHGVWLDVSDTMLSEARDRLARFGDRVSFHVGDMVTMSGVGDAGTFDLITTSRATHHLAVPELTRFYQRCAELLAPGGWLANLDSMSESPEWRRRLRAVRSGYRAAAGRPEVATHPHPNVAPRVSEHLAALCAAGFTEAEVVWRSFVTGLLMARKIDPVRFLRPGSIHRTEGPRPMV